MARPSEREERGFHRRTPEQVRARANQSSGDYDSLFKSKYKVYKPKDGKNLIRILPASFEGADHYGLDLWINYGIGVDNQSYLSLKKMKGEKDPIEEARREAEEDGDAELVKKLKPRKRILMWVIDRNNEDEGPQLFSCPISLDTAIATLSSDEDTKETVYVEDLHEGADVRFYKEGQGLKTDYPAEKIRILKKSPVHEDPDIAKEWKDFVKANPLTECVQYFSYDHIAGTFGGKAARRDDDDDDQPTKKARSNGRDGDEDEAPPKKARPQVDDEDSSYRRRRLDSDANEDDKPSRRQAAEEDDADDDEDVKQTSRKSKIVDGDDDEAPRKTSSRFDEDDNPKRDRRAAERGEDDPEDRPRSSRGGSRAALDEAEEAPKTRRAKIDDDDDPPKRGSSIRDRLRGRDRDDED